MIVALKALAATLCYPTGALQQAAEEFCRLLEEEEIPDELKRALAELLREIATEDLIELQGRYVELFDRTRSLSLHLFEHVHGESRDRGQAMVSLLERYRLAGLDVTASELPDFIPLFLEFISTRDRAEAIADLAEPAHIFAALGERLRKRRSAYAAVFESLVVLSKASPDAVALEELRQTRIEDPSDLTALDRTWEDAEVRFGPDLGNTGSCPRAQTILAAMAVPPEGAERKVRP